jgi:hypothetical protein
MLSACDTAGGPVDRSADAPPQAGDVVIRGTLVAPDDRSVVGRQVIATRRKTGGDLLGDLFTTVFTGGLASLGCLTSDGPIEVCRNGDYSTQTATGGSFGFRLRAGDVTSSLGRPRAVDVSTGLAPAAGEVSGPFVSVRVEAKSGDSAVSLGQLKAWNGNVTARGDDHELRLQWSDPPATGTATLGLVETERGLAITERGASPGHIIDSRLLEDTRPTATVTVTGRLQGRTAVWTSAGSRIAGSAGAPASRGAACTLAVGSAGPAAPAPCWLDDGHFAAGPRIARPTSCQDRKDSFGFDERSCVRAPITTATLDLGREIPISLVVLRTSDDQSSGTHPVVIEGSTDLQNWKRLGEFDGKPLVNQLALLPPRGATARYIRARADGEPAPQPTYLDDAAAVRNDPAATVTEFRGDLAALAEISVWEGKPEPLARPGRLAGSSPTRRGPLLVVAAVLIALLVGGAGYGLGRRRAPD